MFEWKVFRVLPMPSGLQDHGELERQLNEHSKDGWEVFRVFADFTVILRRKL